MFWQKTSLEITLGRQKDRHRGQRCDLHFIFFRNRRRSQLRDLQPNQARARHRNQPHSRVLGQLRSHLIGLYLDPPKSHPLDRRLSQVISPSRSRPRTQRFTRQPNLHEVQRMLRHQIPQRNQQSVPNKTKLLVSSQLRGLLRSRHRGQHFDLHCILFCNRR